MRRSSTSIAFLALHLVLPASHDASGRFAMLAAPLGGGGAAAWSHPLAPPALAPDTSLAKASLPHSNDRIGGSRNSTQPGNTVANRKAAGGVPGGGGGGSSRGAVVAPGGGGHAYAFVANNPNGGLDPMGLWAYNSLGRDASGAHWLYGREHWLYGNTDWIGLNYVDYSAPFRQSGGYMSLGSSSYYDYFNSGSAWDFSNPFDTIDYLHFETRFTDTQADLAAGQSSLLGFGLGPIKSGLELLTGRDLWTGGQVDRASSFQSFLFDAGGLSLGASLGFGRAGGLGNRLGGEIGGFLEGRLTGNSRFSQLRQAAEFLRDEARVLNRGARRQIIESFGNDLRVGEFSGSAYQYFDPRGGGQFSRYLTPHYTANPVGDLALYPQNSGVFFQQYNVSPTRALLGTAAANPFGMPGGGQQIFIPSRSLLSPVKLLAAP